jgi:hypothetical protein
MIPTVTSRFSHRKQMEAEPSPEASHPPPLESAKTNSSSPRKPLDPLVKIALTLSVGLILITVIGMILTAPDRSIPPYSVMAQIGDAVTVNVPSRTTDAQIEALLFRFRLAADGDGFGRLKIKPTTPGHPDGLYQRVTIYVLDNAGLAEESVLREYVAGDPASRGPFERGVRGIYRLTPDSQRAVVGSSEENAKILFESERER